jgi:hypothetical protein
LLKGTVTLGYRGPSVVGGGQVCFVLDKARAQTQ